MSFNPGEQLAARALESSSPHAISAAAHVAGSDESTEINFDPARSKLDSQQINRIEQGKSLDFGGSIDALREQIKALPALGPMATDGADTVHELVEWIVTDPARRATAFREIPLSKEILESSDWWDQLALDAAGGAGALVDYVELPKAPAELLGRRINFPHGMASTNVPIGDQFLPAFANCGFDVLTTRTFRLGDLTPDGHGPPTIADVFLPSLSPGDDVANLVVRPVPMGSKAESRLPRSVVHSIGAPADCHLDIYDQVSKIVEPVDWDGRILIASIYDEPDEVDDWRKLAKLVAAAGAHAVELNLSLPTRPDGMICHNPDTSLDLIQAVRKALRGTDVRVVAKIGYMENSSLEHWFEHCAPAIDGVTAINALKVRAQNEDGSPYFADRPGGEDNLVGLSGPAIGELAAHTVTELNRLRNQMPEDERPVIIGNGSASDYSTYARLRGSGANAVQSCSAAWLDRRLAAMVRIESLAFAVSVQNTPSRGVLQRLVSASFGPHRASISQRGLVSSISQRVFAR